MIQWFSALILIFCTLMASACPQAKAITLDSKLLKTLIKLPPDSSNAYQTEQMIGPACACLPLSAKASESWICQWKGDLSSNRLEKTLNITFSAGMISQIIAIDEKGAFIRP